MKVAAVTMAYNEPHFLPIWARYYSSQIGAEHCYVVDHGSDDGSTKALRGVNVVRIPRSAMNDGQCAKFISTFCASLLEWYDYLIRSDADEIVVADPAHFSSLTDYCTKSQEEVVTAIGFNILHTDNEAPLNFKKKLLNQRKWMYFLSSMCKPVLTRRPLTWSPGFHRAEGVRTKYEDLYLFHLRYIDQDAGLQRLARTRSQPWDEPDAAWWQRISDERCLQIFGQYSGLRKNESVRIDASSPQVREALRNVFGGVDVNSSEEEEKLFNMNYEANELWPIPERLRAIF
jgi:hypothetical protein